MGRFFYSTNVDIVVEYKYDAWGTHSVIALGGTEEEKTANLMIGHLNPFRYRGYYFDEETDLFYLNSRYYDPETGRFINADDISYLDPESINGLNLYKQRHTAAHAIVFSMDIIF